MPAVKNENLTKDIEKTRRNYCEQIYVNKFEKLHEMDKVLVKHELQKSNTKETESLNIHITKTYSIHNLKSSDKENCSPR